MARHYESPLTQFLKQYKTQHADTEARQRAGRGRLWDVELDPEQQEGFRGAYVPQDPYVYYQNA
ncbi:DUF3460 family protein [Castellaniella sp.]|uniref:DUF3460 family protein n=1 Tax=Castellaniella sp. TaxID=1955812 RepID=UPI0035669DB2